jgi:CRISPR/Cas system-associated protein Cas10 (large subunit of type III CRISPR-Cas system)
MIFKIKTFDLRSVDFGTGKKVSPPRDFWNTCDCCGKKIVKGVVMSNSDIIGEDCYVVVQHVQNHAYFQDSEVKNERIFRMFGTTQKVQQYAIGTLK